MQEQHICAPSFPGCVRIRNFLNSSLQSLLDLGSAILEEDDFTEYQTVLSEMSTVYSSTKVKDQNSDREHPLDPDLTAILMKQSTADGPQ